MFIKQLKLIHFRNYDNDSFELGPGVHCVVGLNGVGKTNLLEAIYYLCVGKSPFTGIDRQVVEQAAPFMRLDGTFEKKKQAYRVVVKLIPGVEKTVEKDGKAYERLAEHIGQFPVVMISPEDQELVQGGSDQRRSFIDFTVSQTDTDYLSDLITYRRVWKHKTKSLKTGLEKGRIDIDLIRSYNSQLAGPSARIHKRRLEFTRQMESIIAFIYKDIARKNESLDVRYRSELTDREPEKFYESWLQKECRQGRVLAGVHRDDWLFRINGRSARKYASQGQKKSLTLALKLCQYQFLHKKTEFLPILLLDDIFDKLDRTRVKHLMELLLNGPFGQVFISDTHETRVSDILIKMGQQCHVHNIGERMSKFNEEE